MRQAGDWHAELVKELVADGYPKAVMPAEEFCRVELGLYFLTTHFPGEPIGVLQPVLSGYVRGGDGIESVSRRARHRMGDVARRGYWRTLLNHYMRLPDSVRAFDRTDDPDRRVVDKTVFIPRPSSMCPDRDNAYAAALADPLSYRAARQHRPAEAGKRYRFEVEGGTEHVRLPDHLPDAPGLPRLGVVEARTREPWHVSFDQDLRRTAEEIDTLLEKRPDIRNRDWAKRLKALRFSVANPDSGALEDRAGTFTIDGTEHIVGLMNSGKTTLTDLITVDGVLYRGMRVGQVVSSVGDVYAKVSFLRALGINAVPLIGNSSRGEHAARYWRTMVDETVSLVPDGITPPDPAAGYANASCLLEPYRQVLRPDWAPLAVREFPCRGRLREADVEGSPPHDCPLIAVCPTQKALREVADAQVWVTTPQCLVGTKADPASADVRWLEQAQHDMDLLIIDEADAVQQVLDQRFVQAEDLVGGEGGWTHRMDDYTNSAMARLSMAQVSDPQVQEWYELLQIHEQAVFTLYRLALSPGGKALRDLLGDGTFTAHSLFRQAARMLHGLPHNGDGDKAVEDSAEDFYQRFLQDFAEQPVGNAEHPLQAVVARLAVFPRDEDGVREALDEWINASATVNAKGSGAIDGDRPLLRLAVEAAIWAGRITYTFFEMVTLYPSVRDQLQLPDEERFWLDRPPQDYRPLVPEAPMGNILALRWTPARGGGASLQLLWVHGVGRWLLHHAHDLLACEGIEGPHVILTSATSWIPGSSFYHIPIRPAAVLVQHDDDRDALLASTMAVRPIRAGGNGDPIFVSGRQGQDRHDALRQMVTALCHPVGGRRRSLVDELREQLPPGRQQVLFVVLSGAEAKIVSDAINNKTPYRARHVVPDAAGPGAEGILRRQVGSFGMGDDHILVAAEMSIQRGYNILNADSTAALGAVIYLSRSHPPPADLQFPLSMVSELAMRHLLNPPAVIPGATAEAVSQLRAQARQLWFGIIGRPVRFRTLDHERYRTAFVANNLVPMSQTIGRSIRGNQSTRVLLCDAAFAERLANGDEARDTARTSLVVATDVLLAGLLSPPPEGADRHQQLDYAINEATWGLLGHLFRNNDPLGSLRQ
jgi:restriction endonuclease in pPIWI_RE module